MESKPHYKLHLDGSKKKIKMYSPIRCKNPAIHLYAYEDSTIGKVFVRVPNERGRWMRTDRCVIERPCGQCGSVVGEPCKGLYNNMDRYFVGSHTARSC